MANKLLGKRVIVAIGSGVDSGRTGTVIPWQGSRDKYSYKNEDPRRSVWVQYDDGEQGIMFKNRLLPFGG